MTPADAYMHASLNLVIIGSINGFSPIGCLAITITKADLLSIAPLGTNFREILFMI